MPFDFLFWQSIRLFVLPISCTLCLTNGGGWGGWELIIQKANLKGVRAGTVSGLRAADESVEAAEDDDEEEEEWEYYCPGAFKMGLEQAKKNQEGRR